MRILCFNVGSSVVRLAGFRTSGTDLSEAFPRTSVAGTAWREALDPSFAPDVVAHRIVRGVKTTVPAEVFTDAVNAEIVSTENLAPTHDPHALALVGSARAAFPSAAQVIVYDSAFHSTIPPERSTYALPKAWRDDGVRRVGYHGLSCAYAAHWLSRNAGNPVRAVHVHLGNGCSATALLHGKSVATTMGYTPLDGIVMGTRSGSIDPAILLERQAAGMSAAELRSVLFRESGLRALCGTNDMREIERRLEQGDAQATLAFDIFIASVCGAIAQMASACGGIDALTFGGGIGFHSQRVREAICSQLAWMLGGARIYALDVQEERMMAFAAMQARMPA